MTAERFQHHGFTTWITILIGIAASSPARAQVATSPNYQLDGAGFAATGGGACSDGGLAYTALGDLSFGAFASPNFQVEAGFLAAFDPGLPADLAVFAVTPAFGPTAGGTTVTVSGFDFDPLGAGPTTTVFVGGVPATGVTVTSRTSLTFVTPPGPGGPSSIAITNTSAAAFVANGFLYTPAITSTPEVAMGSNLAIDNYGAPGDTYLTFASTATCVLPAPPYGTLLIGPFPLLQLLPVLPYGFGGHSHVSLPVPEHPLLPGLTVHFQSVSSFSGGGPPPGVLTNSATTTIH